MGRNESSKSAREFWETHDLMNNHSQIIFKAIVTIETDNSPKYREEHKVMIHDNFDSENEVTIMDIQDIDVNEYPTGFMAKFQDYSLDEDENLIIKGRHPRIGNYKAKFIPLGKTSL